MDLGLERAGMQCAWQVEIDEFCRKVLTKHWPNVPRFNDVRECGKHNLEQVDLIAGGFPCQDISIANATAEGITGARSGLWGEMHRIVCEIRPRYVLVENVAEILNRGFERVLSDLAASGYDAEWRVLRARDFGLPHPRRRVFVIAYPASIRRNNGKHGQSPRPYIEGFFQAFSASREVIEFAERFNDEVRAATFVRKADAIPCYVDRLRGLGNAVVPDAAQWIGERIIQSSNQ